MNWWRRNWRWLLACIIVGLVFIVVIILYVLAKKSEAERLRAELALLRAGAKVDGLKADKAARKQELAKNDVEKKKLNDEIAAAKRAAVATVKDVEGMSDSDIALEFRELGY